MTGQKISPNLTLPILNNKASYTFNADNCFQRIAKTIEVIEISPIGISDGYVHKSASCDIGSIAVSVGMGSPFQYSVDDHDFATLMLSTGGSAEVTLGQQTYTCSPNLPVLYLAGERYRCQIKKANGVELRLDRQKLAQSAMVMAERSGREGLDCSRLYRPWLIPSDSRLAVGLQSLLLTTLSYLDHPAIEGFSFTTDRMESLLYQHIIGMLYPELMLSA